MGTGSKTVKEILETGKAITGTGFEVTENGIYSVAVQDNDGRREVETIEIKNIDKTAPKTPTGLIAEYKLSAKKIVLNWKDPTDEESGIKELKLTYKVDGAGPQTATIAKGKKTFVLDNIEPQNPPKPYVFSLKGVDNAGNEGAEVSVTAKPSEQAEVTKITVSRKKIDKNDPDKKVTVTLEGSNLTKAEEIKITGSGTITCTNVTANSASAEFTLPEGVQTYTFRVSVKQPGESSFSYVNGIAAKTQVCENTKVTRMTITKENGSSFASDKFGALKIEAGAGGKMKIVITGTSLDIEELKAGVNFNGQNIDGIVNEAGTELTIENVEIPTASGNYLIQAQLKPRYETEYIIVPDSNSWDGWYKAQLLRVLGEAVLKELWLSGYDKTLEGTEGWLVINGENLDTLTADEFLNISSSLDAAVTEVKIKHNTTLEAKYIIPDLSDDSVVDKTETLTIAGKKISAPLHTLKIKKDYKGKCKVEGYHSIPSDGNLRIPVYIDEIAGRAFRYCTKFTNLDLSGCTKLTKIGESAFSGCTELGSVILPASLTRIDYGAFNGCSKLTSLVFLSCPEIGNQNFDECTEITSISLSASWKEESLSKIRDLRTLTTITIDRDNPVLCAEENVVYNREKTKVIFALKKIKQVSLPATIDEIGGSAFYGCTELASVIFPANLTKIGYQAFNKCSKLESAVFANCVGWAVYSAFSYDNTVEDIKETELENKTTAANYLVSKHRERVWKRN